MVVDPVSILIYEMHVENLATFANVQECSNVFKGLLAFPTFTLESLCKGHISTTLLS